MRTTFDKNRSYRHKQAVEVQREVLPGHSLALLVALLAVVILSRWQHSKRPRPADTTPNSTSSTMREQLPPEVANREDTRDIHTEADTRDSKADNLASSRVARVRTRIKLDTLKVRTGRTLIPPYTLLMLLPLPNPVIR